MFNLKIEIEKLGFNWNESIENAFRFYLDELKRWSRRINLTGIKNDDEIIVKHFIDSINILKVIKRSSFVLDIGSGAGFPGLPAKIVEDSLRLVLIDGIQKKVNFMNHIIRSLGLTNTTALCQRAEERAFQYGLKGTVDVVVSRAVGDFDYLMDIGMPYLKKNGILVFMLGGDDRKAIEIGKRNFNNTHIYHYELPGGYGERRIITITKK